MDRWATAATHVIQFVMLRRTRIARQSREHVLENSSLVLKWIVAGHHHSLRSDLKFGTSRRGQLDTTLMLLREDGHKIIGEIGYPTTHAIQLVILQRTKIILIELRLRIPIPFARLHHCHCSF